jgi:hypothetical protein
LGESGSDYSRGAGFGATEFRVSVQVPTDSDEFGAQLCGQATFRHRHSVSTGT